MMRRRIASSPVHLLTGIVVFVQLRVRFRGLGLMANYSYADSSISGLPQRTDSPSLMGTAKNAFNIEPAYEFGPLRGAHGHVL